LAVAWMLHEVPARPSARERVPVAGWMVPTASQLVGLVQETPLSWLLFWPGGLAVAWTDQLEPFQLSASGKVPALVV